MRFLSQFTQLNFGTKSCCSRCHFTSVVLVAQLRLRRVQFLHAVGQQQLLGVTLTIGGAHEGPMDAVRSPQVSDQFGNKVELLLRHLAIPSITCKHTERQASL